jgi:hypothetical protein
MKKNTQRKFGIWLNSTTSPLPPAEYVLVDNAVGSGAMVLKEALVFGSPKRKLRGSLSKRKSK